MLIQASLQRVGVLEHPAPRDPGLFPCIWGVAAFKHLERLSNIKSIDILQGYYGAKSPKPTRLAICGHDDPAQFLYAFRSTNILPPPLKMGRQKDTGFSTSALKEYPSAMARGLAMFAGSWMESVCTETTCVEPVTPVDRELVEPFIVDLIGLYGRGADTRGAHPCV